MQYEPGTSGPKKGEGECLMHKTLKLGEMEGYGRTFSSYHNWMAAHPEVKARKDGGLFFPLEICMERYLTTHYNRRRRYN